jgi:hypothetical protein
VSGFRAPGFRCAGPYACVTVAVTRAEACAESREERRSYAAGRHRRSRVMARCVQLPFGRVEGSTVRPAQALGTRPSGVLRPSVPRRSSAKRAGLPFARTKRASAVSARSTTLRRRLTTIPSWYGVAPPTSNKCCAIASRRSSSGCLFARARVAGCALIDELVRVVVTVPLSASRSGIATRRSRLVGRLVEQSERRACCCCSKWRVRSRHVLPQPAAPLRFRGRFARGALAFGVVLEKGSSAERGCKPGPAPPALRDRRRDR